jgi:hypothetical protein
MFDTKQTLRHKSRVTRDKELRGGTPAAAWWCPVRTGAVKDEINVETALELSHVYLLDL